MTLEYVPLLHGLSERAGLALALADARREHVRRGIA
jgi:hypothetical protein